MTKEEVLQKVNEYCTEKQYTTATLTDGFKDKFADHFVKGNPDGDINDEAIIANMKFALNTAYSSACDIATIKVNEFQSKENEYKNQITELQGKIKNPPTPQKTEIPDEIKAQLKELQDFKDAKSKQEKLTTIMKLAKEGIRQDLHVSFDKYAADYVVQEDKDEKTQADSLVAKYQEIMRGSIGDIKPLSPKQTQKRDEELLSTINEVKVC